MEKVGIRVRSLREHRGWSQEDLAGKSKLQRSHISLIENNERTPGAESLIKLATALDTTSDFLLGLTDDPAPPPNPSKLTAIEAAARDRLFGDIVEAWPTLDKNHRIIVRSIVKELARKVREREQ